MPLYRFIVHGRITGANAPKGFHTTRWCRARDQKNAAEKALGIVRHDLNKECPTSWTISDLEVEEGCRIRFWEIRSAPNRGSTFYEDD